MHYATYSYNQFVPTPLPTPLPTPSRCQAKLLIKYTTTTSRYSGSLFTHQATLLFQQVFAKESRFS